MAVSLSDRFSYLSQISGSKRRPLGSILPKSLYRYRPLQLDHIRLLRLLPPARRKKHPDTTSIECELFHVPLEDTGHYEALSYVWGPPKPTEAIRIKSGGIRLQENVLKVTNSLFTALMNLRYASRPRYLWVDQLCINQDDTTEKSAQVSRMGEIYSKASCTVVWLGARGDDAELLEDMYRRLSTLSSNAEDSGGVLMLDHEALARVIGTSYREENGDDLIRRRRRLLERFLDLPWFCRVWVYQEAVVASRVDMVWGNIVLPLDFVTGLVVSVYGTAKSAEDGHWHKRIKDTKGFAPVRTIYHDRKAHRKRELDFLNVLWHARKHLNTTDPRDYVFAFLCVNKYTDTPSKPCQRVISPLQDLVTPNYEASVEDVYTDLALAAIRSSCSLDILQYVVPTKPSPKTYSLPTWVANWADRSFISGSPIFVPGVPNHFSACRGKSHALASANSNRLKLSVSGHRLGCIDTVLRHSFKHTYFSPTLKEAYQLEKVETLLDTQVKKLAQKTLCKQVPDWFLGNPRKTLLRTILAGGSFTTTQEICYPIEDLLEAYDKVDGDHLADDAERLAILRHYLRQTGEVASGKRLFLTGELDIGLGFSTIRKGDIVCILYGSKMPCILRKEDLSRDRYVFVGLCFLDGWMDGTKNPRNWDWWNQSPERFVLI